MSTPNIFSKKRLITIGLLFLTFALSACSLLLPGSDLEELTFPTATPKPIITVTEPVDPSDTAVPQPTDTVKPTPTETLVPTPTPLPTETPPAIACDWAEFVMDVTVPDGADYLPEENYTKTWQIKNIGLCTWTPEYKLVFAGGAQMGGPLEISMPHYVLPNETVYVSVPLSAPKEEGNYKGYWLLENELGQLFGTGETASSTIWVEIDVLLPCDWAQFVKDVTVPDNTEFAPGMSFTKTWRLKNIGSCTWTTDYDLVFESGNGLSGQAEIALQHKVTPGETIDISVEFTAPDTAGEYKGYWMLRNKNGGKFGIGARQNAAIWVDISVIEPDNDLAFDFAFYYCLASWASGEGSLDCPGTLNDEDGFVSYVPSPALENRHEDEAALWVHPDENTTGWISGKYPAVKVSTGDHFRAWVGCMERSEQCKISFRLDYILGNGELRNLGIWQERYDGQVSVIDIDLTFLAGSDVVFILSTHVENNHLDQADGFWFAPRLESVESNVSFEKPGDVNRSEESN